MERVVLVEDGGAVQQADATDCAPEDQVIMWCSGKGAREREQRLAAVSSADLQRRTPPAQSPRRVSGAGERVPLAGFRASVRPVALHDRVDIGCFSRGVGQRLRVGERKRQAVREGGIGVAEGVSGRDDPLHAGSPVRSTFTSPPIGMTSVIGRA
jgi:hypothetical protein